MLGAPPNHVPRPFDLHAERAGTGRECSSGMLSRSGVSCAARRAKCHPAIKKCHHGKRVREPQRCTFLFSRASARDASSVITRAAEVDRWRRLLAHDGNEVREARGAAAATWGGRDTASTVYSLLVERPREVGVGVTGWPT